VTPPFLVTFPRSAASTYHEALRLAQQAQAYRELPDGRRLLHEATFGVDADQLAALAELWGLLRTWKSARLVVDGLAVQGVDRWRVLEVLQCAARAARMSPGPPQRYCTSAPADPWTRWPGRPTFPCRLVVSRRLIDLEHGIDWTEPVRRMDQVRAALLERGILSCPFLALGPFEAALAGWTPTGPSGPARAGPAGLHIRLEFGTEAPEPAVAPSDDPLPPARPGDVDEVLRRLTEEAR
jgi:hypothetical protein